LGHYETADFWAEYESETETSEKLYEKAKKDVEKAVAEFQKEQSDKPPF
jgi:hypothetical protein